MDEVKEWLGYLREHRYLVLAGVAVGSLVLKKLMGRKESFPSCPPNTVQLFQFPRSSRAPSPSPFVLKLETYLRMANIPYQNEFGFRFGAKGKMPWIRYNSQSIGDSQLCINFLNKVRGIDLDRHLNDKEKAVALSFQRLVDEHLFWAILYYIWITDAGFHHFDQYARGNLIEKLFFRFLVRPQRAKAGWAQGMLRHTPQEIRQFALEDFKALADWMGDKKFLMGDEPCEADAAVFGLLAQFLWQLEPEAGRLLPDHCPSLVTYCERMRNRFWPDWDQCITHGGTRKALK